MCHTWIRDDYSEIGRYSDLREVQDAVAQAVISRKRNPSEPVVTTGTPQSSFAEVPFWAVVSVLMIVGLAVRAFGIGDLGLWYDEIVLWAYALGGDPLVFEAPHEPPLMPLLAYAGMWWAGTANPDVFHAMPILIGSLAIPVAFAFAARIRPGNSGKIAGLLAATLIALSPIAIYYAREGRPYALLMVASACLYFSFVNACASNRLGAWLTFSACGTLTALSHLLAAQVFIVIGTTALAMLVIPSLTGLGRTARIERFRNIVVFGTLGGVPGCAWIIARQFELSGHGYQGFFYSATGSYPYGLVNFARDIFNNLGPGPVAPYAERAAGWPEVFAVAVLAAFVVGLIVLYRDGRRDLVLLFVLALAVPATLHFFSIAKVANWTWMRYIVHLVIPYLVVAAIGLEAAGRALRARGSAIALVVIPLAGMLPASVERPERTGATQFREQARVIEANAGEYEGVIVLPYLHTKGNADLRISIAYDLHKRDHLPVMHASFGQLRTVEWMPGRRGLGRLPHESIVLRELPPGRYAILSRRPFRDCGALTEWLVDLNLRARASKPVADGLTECNLEEET